MYKRRHNEDHAVNVGAARYVDLVAGSRCSRGNSCSDHACTYLRSVCIPCLEQLASLISAHAPILTQPVHSFAVCNAEVEGLRLAPLRSVDILHQGLVRRACSSCIALNAAP